jgi:hypothetical protein
MNKPAIIYDAGAEFAQSYFYELCYCSTPSSVLIAPPTALRMRRILDNAKSSLHLILHFTLRKLSFSAAAKQKSGIYVCKCAARPRIYTKPFSSVPALCDDTL